MTRRRFIAGLALAAVAQVGIIGAMVGSRVAILRDGPEIAVRSTFVDPRDIFRGHYVRLDLTVAPPTDAPLTTDPALGQYADIAYAILREGDDGFWVARSIHAEPPADADNLVLRVSYSAGNDDAPPRIILPHDRYFANRTRALELEYLRRDQKLGVILALDGDGGAVIKGLTIDGERIYDEPLL